VLRDAREIGVGRQELQFVASAELGEDRADRAHLGASPSRATANLRGFKVVVTVGCDERKSQRPDARVNEKARPRERSCL